MSFSNAAGNVTAFLQEYENFHFWNVLYAGHMVCIHILRVLISSRFQWITPKLPTSCSSTLCPLSKPSVSKAQFPNSPLLAVQWVPTAMAKCGACSLPLAGAASTDALGKSWHQKCFRCKSCGDLLTS